MSKRSFESVYKELQANVESRSHLVNLLPALRKAHERELQEAMHGFLEELFDGEWVRKCGDDAARNAIKNHARDCDREDLARRLKAYYEDPAKYNPKEEEPVLGGIPFERNCIEYGTVQAIVMYPNHEFTAKDFFRRLYYLLGEDIEEDE